MSAASKRALLVVAVAVVAALGVGAGYALRGSGDDSGSKAVSTSGSSTTTGDPGSSTSTTATPSTIPPPSTVDTTALTGDALELANDINRAAQLTYHATYDGDHRTSAGDTTHITLELWHQVDLARRDTTIVAAEGTLHTRELRLPDQLLGCVDKNKTGDPDWLCLPSGAQGVDPAEPLLGEARPTDGTVVGRSDTVAGAAARCFSVSSTDTSKVQDVCFDSDGIPLSIDGGDGKVVRSHLDRGFDPAVIAIPKGATMQTTTTRPGASPA